VGHDRPVKRRESAVAETTSLRDGRDSPTPAEESTSRQERPRPEIRRLSLIEGYYQDGRSGDVSLLADLGSLDGGHRQPARGISLEADHPVSECAILRVIASQQLIDSRSQPVKIHRARLHHGVQFLESVFLAIEIVRICRERQNRNLSPFW
jgi:hypothetical protein